MSFSRYIVYTDTVKIPIPKDTYPSATVLTPDIALKTYKAQEKKPVLVKICATKEGAAEMLHNFIPNAVLEHVKNTDTYEWLADIAVVVEDKYKYYDSDLAYPSEDNITCCKIRIIKSEDEEDIEINDENRAYYYGEEYMQFQNRFSTWISADELAYCGDSFDAFLADLGYPHELDALGEFDDIIAGLYQVFRTFTIPMHELIALAGGVANVSCRYNISRRTVEGWNQGRECSGTTRILLARDIGILNIWTRELSSPI